MGKGGGIFSTIVGTIALTAVAIAHRRAPRRGDGDLPHGVHLGGPVTRVIRFGADCLAGIPSIIFGLFGFILFVTKLKFGWSILSGGLTLAFMLLPTIIRTSRGGHQERAPGLPPGQLLPGQHEVADGHPGRPALGPAGHRHGGRPQHRAQPRARRRPSIFTAGSALRMPTSVFSSTRTMAVHFYILAREGISMPNAYGTAAILIIAILGINILTYYLMNRFIRKYS